MTRSARVRPLTLLQLLLFTAISLGGEPPLLAQTPSDRAAGGGSAQRQTWVLITGIVGGVAGFNALKSKLEADGSRAIIIDPYHLSLDSQDVSYAALARRVDRELVAQHVSEAHVVGHANGAGVALRLAERSPTRVASLSFLDAGALRASAGRTLRGSIRFIPFVTKLPGGRAYVRSRFVSGLREHAGQQQWLTDSTQRAYIEPMLNDIGRVVALAMRLGQTVERDTLEQIVDRLRIPVTIILGAAPHQSGAGPDEIAVLRPIGVRLSVIRLPGVGHFPHEEATQQVADLLGTARRRAVTVARVDP